MIRDITIGQYYKAGSCIHRLDPRTKIIATLVYIIGLFVLKSFAGLAFAAAVLAVCVAVSRVPVSFMLRGLKPVFLIILFTFVLNMFIYDGEILVKIWIFTITKEGLRTAFFMAARLILRYILTMYISTFQASKRISLSLLQQTV